MHGHKISNRNSSPPTLRLEVGVFFLKTDKTKMQHIYNRINFLNLDCLKLVEEYPKEGKINNNII